MALTFVSSVPTSGGTDYYLNKSITATFNKALDGDTVTSDVISLIDRVGGHVVPTLKQIDPSDSSTVIITPKQALREDTPYILQILGTEAGLGVYLSAEDGEDLVTTLVIQFTTGDTFYIVDTTAGKSATTLENEGDLFLPSNVQALGLDLTISSITPANGRAGVDVTLNGSNQVVFTFSEALNSSALTGTWASVDIYPLLGDSDYLAQSGVLDLGAQGYTLPDSSLSVTGSDLKVTFDASPPQNSVIEVVLTQNILSENEHYFPEETTYRISTSLYPDLKWFVRQVLNDTKATRVPLSQEYISFLLLKNALAYWEMSRRTLSLTSLPWSYKRLIVVKTLIDNNAC